MKLKAIPAAIREFIEPLPPHHGLKCGYTFKFRRRNPIDRIAMWFVYRYLNRGYWHIRRRFTGPRNRGFNGHTQARDAHSYRIYLSKPHEVEMASVNRQNEIWNAGIEHGRETRRVIAALRLRPMIADDIMPVFNTIVPTTIDSPETFH